MSLTKAELADSLCENFELNKTEAKILVDNFFEELCLALQEGNSIKLSGFGNFDLKQKNSRPGRNPKTGEDVVITPRTVVTFKAGQKLKDAVSDKQK